MEMREGGKHIDRRKHEEITTHGSLWHVGTFRKVSRVADGIVGGRQGDRRRGAGTRAEGGLGCCRFGPGSYDLLMRIKIHFVFLLHRKPEAAFQNGTIWFCKLPFSPSPYFSSNIPFISLMKTICSVLKELEGRSEERLLFTLCCRESVLSAPNSLQRNKWAPSCCKARTCF